MTANATRRAYTVRLEEPLADAIETISLATGQTVNALLAQGAASIAETYGNTTQVQASVMNLSSLRASYAASPVVENQSLRLSKWTSTPEEEKTDEQ